MTADETVLDAHAALVRGRILDGVARLLAAGEELTFARIASAAAVSERTVYRHFANRDTLMAAVYSWANERIGFVGSPPETAAAMVEMVRRVFPGFDTIAPVVDELLASEEGRRARLADLDARRRAAEAVVADAVPTFDPTTRRHVAAVVQVLGSAAVWQALRDFWGMDGAEAGDAVGTVIDLLLTSPTTKGAPR
jgi:AcrR family transcriptional regulator